MREKPKIARDPQHHNDRLNDNEAPAPHTRCDSIRHLLSYGHLFINNFINIDDGSVYMFESRKLEVHSLKHWGMPFAMTVAPGWGRQFRTRSNIHVASPFLSVVSSTRGASLSAYAVPRWSLHQSRSL